METSLINRLELLYKTDQIERDIYQLLPVLLHKVEARLQINLDEQNAGPFLTHLSLALQRCKLGQPIQEATEDVKAISEQYPQFDTLAREILSAFINKQLDISAEASFLALYFVMLTGSEADEVKEVGT